MRSQMNTEGTVRGYEQVTILRQTDLMMTVTLGRGKEMENRRKKRELVQDIQHLNKRKTLKK